MTTQYTTILKLALPVQGELSGTWGDVVNDNITQMVEQAVAGKAVINTWTGNSHTLTTADGTTSESRCAILELTDSGTALTGAGTVVCPTNTKLYIVDNNTAQIVTVKTSGGTGVAVPVGKTMLVYCDGTNVVEGVTHANSLSLGTSTVTADKILDEDNMASDSATAIATQQSIKAYVDSQVGTVDTLSEILANGNTTGANDIDVDSAQKVQFRDAAIYINSSVDGQLDIVADGEVQIDTALVDINGNLDVSGTTNISGSVSFTKNAIAGVAISTTSRSSNTVTVTTSAVHGLTSGDLVNVNGVADTSFNGYFTVSVSSTTVFTYNQTGADGSSTGGTSTEVVYNLNASGTALNWMNGPLNIAANSGIDGLEITQSGAGNGLHVTGTTGLVGNTTLTGNLDVSGDIDIDGTTNLDVVDIDGAVDMASTLGVTGVATLASLVATTADINAGTIDGTVIGGATAAAASFTTFTSTGIDDNATSTAITIDSGENIGVNITPENSTGTWRNFEVGGANLSHRSNGANDAMLGTGFVFKTDNSEVYKNSEAVSRLFFNNNVMSFQQAGTGTAGNAISWSEAMHIDASGNVGISTISPAAKLDLGTSTGQKLLMYANSNIKYGMSIETSDYRIFAEDQASLTFGHMARADGTTYTERLRIASSGNVGIGTSSPQTSLSIETSGTQDVVSPVVTGQTAGVTYGGLYTVRDGAGDQRGLALKVYTANVGLNTAMRIDSSGKLLIGDSASHTDDLLQIETPASGGGHGIQIRRNDTNTDQGVGRIQFGNNTATDLASISAKTDGAADNGALLFNTSVSGGANTERMRIDSSGQLSAVSASNVRLTLGSEGTVGNNSSNWIRGNSNSLQFNNAGGGFMWEAIGSERMRLDAGGSLLIGKTTPADLHDSWNHIIIGEKGAIISTKGGVGLDGITLADNAYVDSDTGNYAYQTTGAASLINQTGGAITFSNAASGSAGAALTPVPRMTLEASGNIKQNSVNTSTNAGYAVNNGTYDAIALGTGGFGVNGGAATDGGIRAYNNLLFGTGASSTERMRIDASGQVRLGNSTPTWDTTFSSLVTKGGFLGSQSSSYLYSGQNSYYNGGFKYSTAAAATLYEQSFGAHTFYNAASGTAGNAITWNPAMTLTASGNALVGRTASLTGQSESISSDTVMSVHGALASHQTDAGILQYTGGIFSLRAYGSASNGVIAFNTGGGGGGADAEAMRIDASGNLLVGTTSSDAKLHVGSDLTSIQAFRAFGDTTGDTANVCGQFGKYDNNTTTSQVFVNFTVNNGGTAQGQINANGASQAAFGAWSDRRLKLNIENLPSQLANITALRPVEFDYIESEGGGHQLGFIAQEVEEIYPDLVGERQDGMKTLSGMGKMEARLIKAIQEQQATIEALTARIAALES